MVETRRRFPLFARALLGLLFAVCWALVACGEDGVTPDCPQVPLYNVHDENWLEGVAGARAEAIDAGCLTDLGDAETAE
jgi:hypothetical protein